MKTIEIEHEQIMNALNMKDIENYCLEILRKSRCRALPFHGIKHTVEVFENVLLIGGYENINDEEQEILNIAALFHDTGMSETYIGHEDVSANNAKTYLNEHSYPKEKIKRVLKCVKATKMPQNPKTLLECVMCDADLSHLASTNYLFKNELLRTEWANYMDLVFTDEEWYQLNLEFLINHTYHTNFGKTVLKEGKQRNIELLEQLKKDAIN
ncbi:HD domain-containing protein [Subsaxibacter sp. CAU 1640]|uniref:HD domain-containing protein n=1 Tax=Subsaxibacter sp. CAU 1640 TaxID=2933271 RepID=UPI002002E17D|nr:HD domain-containing protein [Subsaxibacter sp. CAU 1640]MCK7591340.1 HD domain-containing protein [Subsaxibacter sp. CAU 1640]